MTSEVSSVDFNAHGIWKFVGLSLLIHALVVGVMMVRSLQGPVFNVWDQYSFVTVTGVEIIPKDLNSQRPSNPTQSARTAFSQKQPKSLGDGERNISEGNFQAPESVTHSESGSLEGESWEPVDLMGTSDSPEGRYLGAFWLAFKRQLGFWWRGNAIRFNGPHEDLKFKVFVRIDPQGKLFWDHCETEDSEAMFVCHELLAFLRRWEQFASPDQWQAPGRDRYVVVPVHLAF